MQLQRSVTSASEAPNNLVSLRTGWHIIGELELAGIVADHAHLRTLCDRLELVADGLPSLPESTLVDDLSTELSTLAFGLPGRRRRVFERLFAGQASEPLRTILLSRIGRQHLAEAIAAEDLAAALRPSIPGTPTLSADALGFMLRSFFEAVRADMAFETLALMTLGACRLTREASALLVGRLSASARGF